MSIIVNSNGTSVEKSNFYFLQRQKLMIETLAVDYMMIFHLQQIDFCFQCSYWNLRDKWQTNQNTEWYALC